MMYQSANNLTLLLLPLPSFYSAEGAILLEHTPPSTRNQITKNFVCGGIAGLVQSTVICPMEHVKCRLQIQHAKGASDYVYKNSFDAASKIVGRHGVRGIYRGMTSTCWREGKYELDSESVCICGNLDCAEMAVLRLKSCNIS